MLCWYSFEQSIGGNLHVKIKKRTENGADSDFDNRTCHIAVDRDHMDCNQKQYGYGNNADDNQRIVCLWTG